VLDRGDLDSVAGVVDSVDDAVAASARAMEAREFKAQGLADTVRVVRERAEDELDLCDLWHVP
jgi:hypothetical protein